jgi:hypothetical protein
MGVGVTTGVGVGGKVGVAVGLAIIVVVAPGTSRRLGPSLEVALVTGGNTLGLPEMR